MGFQEAIKSFYSRYVDFQTRSSRSEYWWFVLFTMIVYVVFIILIALTGGLSSGGLESGNLSPVATILMIPLGLFVLANIIPSIALAVRRLHDLNYSGWFYLLFIVISIIPIISLIAVIVWIVFMCKRGTIGPNKFGNDPLENFGDTFS